MPLSWQVFPDSHRLQNTRSWELGALRDRNVIIFGTSRADETNLTGRRLCKLPRVDAAVHRGPGWQQALILHTAHGVPQRRQRLQQDTYLSFLSRHFTKIGRIPDFIKSSIGGFLSLDSSFLGRTETNVWAPVVTQEQSLGGCLPSPGCLHSTELDNRVDTRSILQSQEYIRVKHQ